MSNIKDKQYLLKRLEKHTIKDQTTGCWLWIGNLSKGGKSEGYGRINLFGIIFYVHRVSAYIYFDMPLHKIIDKFTKNSQALHKTICPNKNCWNPEHIYVGTHKDNMLDRDFGA